MNVNFWELSWMFIQIKNLQTGSTNAGWVHHSENNYPDYTFLPQDKPSGTNVVNKQQITTDQHSEQVSHYYQQCLQGNVVNFNPPILQYGWGRSSDFLANIFGVDTSHLSLCISFLSSFFYIWDWQECSSCPGTLWLKLNYWDLTPFRICQSE